jgi:hypothetical protein
MARRRLKNFTGSVDAIIGFFDFPVTTILPILSEEFGLPSASLESVLKCEHKYWSRLEQREVAGKFIPQFYGFDPFDESFLETEPLLYPFWIKPAKSFRGYLAYQINDAASFVTSIYEIREHIDRISEPFQHLLDQVELPQEVARLGGRCCVAESPLSGQQCTLEGYVHDGEVTIYGVVDSVRETDRSSFSRYEYPSRLPQHVLDQMADIASRVITRIGYDNATFNIEFFYSLTEDRPYLLEINPRLSQSHAYLFQEVDGVSHHQIMIDLSLGNPPAPPVRAGRYKRAAKFMLRYHDDGVLTRVPTRAELDEIMSRVPGTLVDVLVEEGTHLSALRNQDSYSYEIADVYVAADSEQQLLEKYGRVTEELQFELRPVTESLELPSRDIRRFGRDEVIPD